MSNDDLETPWGSLFASSTSDVWSEGVGFLDEWSLGQWARTEGYRLAGQLLTEAAQHQPPQYSDMLVFPIAYVYRHTLELKLKDCIRDGTAYLGNERVPDRIHDLVSLWDDFQGVLEDCGVGRGLSGWPHLREVVHQLQDVDKPNATAFRYADEGDGESLLPDDLTVIDTKLFGHHLEQALDVLDGWQMALEAARDGRREMRQQAPPPPGH